MPNRQPPPPSHQQHAAHSSPTPPPQQHTPPVAASQGPGLFGQMASTAAGVAVGSAVGHTLANGVSSMFGGAQPQEHAPVNDQSYQQPQQQQPLSCDENAKALTKCLSENNNDVSACQWYLDALKACQQMAAQY